MQQLLIATTNRGKLDEYRQLLTDLPFELIDLAQAGISDDVEETGLTFEANAKLKALAYAQLSGILTLADDPGLEVAALGGEPGVYSARYGGSGLDDIQRYQLVLDKLRAIPTDQRQARFVCVIAIATPDRQLMMTEGVVDGLITTEPRGTNGFGYDPIFLLVNRNLTTAELHPEDKNRISHRALAAYKARSILIGLQHNDRDSASFIANDQNTSL